MIKKDVQDEENAINLYKKIIEQATKRKMSPPPSCSRNPGAGRGHHDTFTTLLETYKVYRALFKAGHRVF